MSHRNKQRTVSSWVSNLCPARVERPKAAATLAIALSISALLAPQAHAQNTWYRPFAANSIWNTPIGSNAQFVSCNLGVLGALDNDRENLFITSASDPYYSVDQPGSTVAQNGVNLWSGFNVGLEPNGGAAFLLPDGVTSRQYNYFEVDSPGSQPYGWYWGDHPINGDGLGGGHAGGDMSVLGGTIRVGEMESGVPITHPLKIELDWAVLYHSSTNQANESQTYRWPAQNSDSNFGGTGTGPGYTGTNAALCMGSLCCLPPSVNINSLGLSAQGLKIAQAMQNYGAYVVDTTGNHWQWGNGGYTMGLCVEKQETINNSGYFYNPNNYINSGTFYNDMNLIYQNLSVVNNNSSSSIGGGGTVSNYSSGFEPTDLQPTWNNTPDNDYWTSSTNPSNVSGFISSVGPECGIRGNGDWGGINAEDGSQMLMTAGTANGGSATFCYYKVYDLSANPVLIQSSSTISYWINPVEDNGRYIAVDFHCTDGTTLRDSGIVDQNGYSVHPAAGHGGSIPLGSWSQISASLAALAGKSVDRIWVAYDRPGSTGQYRAYIDDLVIDPPAVALPKAPTGLSTSAGNAQIAISWTAPTGTVTGYKLYRSTTAGGEGTVAYKSGLTTTSYTDTGLTNGTTYYYKVAAINGTGTGAQSIEASGKPAAVPTEVNDNNSKVVYSGTWVTSTDSGYYDGDMHYSSVTGSSVTFSFTGTSVSWIGGKSSNHGIASISVDGGTATTLDTYSATWLKQQTLFTKSGLASGNHTIKITLGTTKNSASTGYNQDVDAFLYQ